MAGFVQELPLGDFRWAEFGPTSRRGHPRLSPKFLIKISGESHVVIYIVQVESHFLCHFLVVQDVDLHHTAVVSVLLALEHASLGVVLSVSRFTSGDLG